MCAFFQMSALRICWFVNHSDIRQPTQRQLYIVVKVGAINTGYVISSVVFVYGLVYHLDVGDSTSCTFINVKAFEFFQNKYVLYQLDPDLTMALLIYHITVGNLDYNCCLVK